MIHMDSGCPAVGEARETGKGGPLWKETIGAICLYIFVSMIVDTIYVIIMEDVLKIQVELHWEIGYLYIQILTTVIVLAFCHFKQRRSIRSVGFVKEGAVKQYLKGAAVGLTMMIAVVSIGTVLGGFRYSGLSDEIAPLYLLVFLGGYLIQGMAEEVVFRGYIMVFIARRNSLLAAIITNSILFSLTHCFNSGFGVLPMINLFLFGVFVSLYMLKTGDIWGACAIHSVWNFAQGCIFGLSVSGGALSPTIFVFESAGNVWLNGGEFGPEGGLIDGFVSIFGIVLLILTGKKTNPSKERISV